ncbi:tRNA methyltransferase 10 homolog C-like [Amphiura filiformis]|uniref:tRNA methyltransferase 10 homolog C-like n=1 Tax=Amphiura filiformis TaxID=82378 RepID=UPI003B20EA01
MAFSQRICTRLLNVGSQEHVKCCWGHIDSTYNRHLHVRKMLAVRHFRTLGHLGQRHKLQSNLSFPTARGVRSLVGTTSGLTSRSWQISVCRYSSVATETNQLQDWIEKQRENIYEIPMKIETADIEYMRMMSNSEKKKYLRKLYVKEQGQVLGDGGKLKSDKSKFKSSDFVRNKSTSFILRTRRETVQHYDMWRVAAAMKFGLEIAIDFMHDQSLTKTYMSSLVKQIMHLNATNMSAKEPFHLHCVNFNESGLFFEEMNHMRLSMDSLMVDVTSKGLLDMFPREKIMYICPDSNNRITYYNPNMVYVIPALCCEPSADRGAILAQAKKLNIAHARPMVLGAFPNVNGLVNTLMSLKVARDSGKTVIKPNLHVQREARNRDQTFSFSRAKPVKSRGKKKY